MKLLIQGLLKVYNKDKWRICFVLGLLAVLIFLLPYYVLRENAYFMIHDELDDGIFKLMLYAKNLGVNGNYVPEFMGGQNRSAITISSVWGVLIYKIFPPYAAFAVMLSVVVLTGYLGLFLLGREISDNAFASAAVATLFSYLPFKSMFGLNIVGFPLLIWILIKISKNPIKKCIVYYFLLMFYATGITLAWGGYMSVGLLSLAIVILTILRKKVKVNLSNLIVADLMLIVVQIFVSIDLIMITFGPNSIVSHREELVLNSRSDLFNLFKDMMYFGGAHSECCSKVIAISSLFFIALVPIAICFLCKSEKESAQKMKKKYVLLCVFYASCLLNSLFTCFYTSVPIVEIRQNIGGVIKTFQLNRIYWIMPTCFMCVLILDVAILSDCAKILYGKFAGKIKYPVSAVPVICMFALIVAYAVNVYYSSPIYHNLRLMRFPNTYHVESWRRYYAEDLFKEVEATIGKDKNEYRVACVGVNPAVALYNGFSTVDGYSTDYPLEYKHRFRKVIESELEKSDSLKAYFDNWGNRCYLLSSELDGYKDVYRGENISINPNWNMTELRSLNANYIISGVLIENSGDLGLRLLNEEPLVADADSYAIRVYEILGE